MKRISFYTGVAIIGIWDKAFLTEQWWQSVDSDSETQFEKDTEAGQLFAVMMGSDGGDYAHVYTDENISEDDKYGYKEINKSYLIKTISGKLTLGGIEHYNYKDNFSNDENNMFEVAPGSYTLRMYEAIDEDEKDPLNAFVHEKLKNEFGVNHYNYWMRLSKRKIIATLVTMAIATLAIWLVAWDSFAASAFAGVIFGLVIGYPCAKFFVNNISSYRSINQRYYQLVIDDRPPMFLFELLSIKGEHNVKGGIHYMDME